MLTQWQALLAEVKRPMDKRRYELVTFVAAQAFGSSPCSLAHGRVLREFFADDQIVALVQGRFEQVLGAADAALARFAHRVVVEASGITAADIESLRAHGFGDAELFDVAAAVGVRALFTRVLDAMGVQPDAPFAQLPAPLREALTIGRAIGNGPCQAMPVEAPSTEGARRRLTRYALGAASATAPSLREVSGPGVGTLAASSSTRKDRRCPRTRFACGSTRTPKRPPASTPPPSPTAG